MEFKIIPVIVLIVSFAIICVETTGKKDRKLTKIEQAGYNRILEYVLPLFYRWSPCEYNQTSM
jgi:hypothetical protein